MTEKKYSQTTVKTLTVTAVFMAVNIAMSSFGVPVPGGHMYLNDVVIVAAALILNPFEAFCVGGIGAFLGDLFFYPTPMFVSLVVHGLQAVVISLIVHRFPRITRVALLAVILGVAINVIGYTIGRAFIYATPEAAALKLPFQILQAAVGSLIGFALIYKLHLDKYLHI